MARRRAECMDLQALGAHGHDLVANLHDVREAHFIQPLGQADSTFFCRHAFSLSREDSVFRIPDAIRGRSLRLRE